jgi:hypothetical protein
MTTNLPLDPIFLIYQYAWPSVRWADLISTLQLQIHAANLVRLTTTRTGSIDMNIIVVKPMPEMFRWYSI